MQRSAGGSSFDPDQSNNAAFCLVNAGYQSLPDMVNRVRLTASNIIYDSVHKVLWATIPAAQGAPLGRSLISLNPLNGQVGAPVALNGDARPGCFALSANARYLYVGLTDAPEVVRFDMATVPPVALRIPLALSQWGNVVHAEEIQVLDGDGTSFLMTEKEDGVAAVYDGIVLRPNRTAIYTVDNIERTSTPGVFNGLNQELPDTGTVLSVTASGVSVVASSSDLFSGNNINICGSGGLLLSSTGELLDPAALVITAALGVAGRPCLDAGNQRAFIVNGSAIWGFNTATGLAVGSLALPTIALGDWAQSCVRWGVDGLAVLGNDGMIYIARWSQANTTDLNANGIPDTWEMANFNSLAVDMNADADGDGISNAMEYLFGTSPTSPSGNPLHIVLSTGGLGMQVQAQGLTSQSIRLGFPRRAGLPAGFYRFDSTSDLQTWSPVQGVSETVVSTATVGGVAIENVEAVVPLPAGGKGFVRMVTTGP